MRYVSRLAAFAGCWGAIALVVACAPAYRLEAPASRGFHRSAPDSFEVRFTTTKGVVDVRFHRAWSQAGVDRVHALVRAGYYDNAAFFRTIKNFVAQFGLHGDTVIARAWSEQSIPDEAVRRPNARGTVSFARGGPNTRGVQLFFNTVDNTPRLDTINGFGFPVLGHVVSGLPVLDSLNWEYSGTRGGQTFPGPSQDSIRVLGGSYLQRAFPRLDYIRTARVIRRW